MSLIRTWAGNTQQSFYVTDQDQRGLFVYDSTDTTTPDDSAMTLVSGGKRYKRDYIYFIDARKMFGIQATLLIVDSVALKKQTALIQKALDYAYKASSPGSSVQPNRGRSCVVYFDAGAYLTWGTLYLRGSGKMTGPGRMSYGGALFYGVKDHVPMFQLMPDVNGGNNCWAIEHLGFRQGTPASATASIFYAGPESSNGVHRPDLR